MALTLNSDAQSVFFTKVFGPTHTVTQQVKSLIAAGTTFEIAVYTIKATWQGKSYLVNLTKGTTALMKHEVDFPVASQNEKLIAEWVLNLHEKVYSAMGAEAASIFQKLTYKTASEDAAKEIKVILTGVGPATNVLVLIKAIRILTGLTLTECKAIADHAVAGHAQYLKTYPNLNAAQNAVKELEFAGGVVELQYNNGTPVKAAVSVVQSLENVTASLEQLNQTLSKPVNKVINLKDAKALGQQVHGTSKGSVYHCIAVSEHVKVAARLYKTGGISIRTEWTDNPQAELEKLKEAGVQMKGDYGSIHFDAGEVPLQRVVGAFLMGAGINWKAVVTNGADLVIGDK